jgi:hypothetical protein
MIFSSARRVVIATVGLSALAWSSSSRAQPVARAAGIAQLITDAAVAAQRARTLEDLRRIVPGCRSRVGFVLRNYAVIRAALSALSAPAPDPMLWDSAGLTACVEAFDALAAVDFQAPKDQVSAVRDQLDITTAAFGASDFTSCFGFAASLTLGRLMDRVGPVSVAERRAAHRTHRQIARAWLDPAQAGSLAALYDRRTRDANAHMTSQDPATQLLGQQFQAQADGLAALSDQIQRLANLTD